MALELDDDRVAELARAFAALPVRQRHNLRVNAAAGAGICCRERALMYTAADGSG